MQFLFAVAFFSPPCSVLRGAEGANSTSPPSAAPAPSFRESQVVLAVPWWRARPEPSRILDDPPTAVGEDVGGGVNMLEVGHSLGLC